MYWHHAGTSGAEGASIEAAVASTAARVVELVSPSAKATGSLVLPRSCCDGEFAEPDANKS
eukprot:CAMPEP_0204050014 /NCGR_PEP_ID=MMETSP0360-20130528/119489_1 /ASSEMBLY_ACC=CAM_ASM_000342 /TAXON_ID=268821 /ORGANISM="Scrippsiella Hangoei, Strain SHTV-5" /LENGTH=60 /DNA_ID=CAMNT_0050996941 /DNA_START=372 /DNA_END=551 /DNA_ORIENTATION=+